METYLDNTNDWMLKLVKKEQNKCMYSIFYLFYIIYSFCNVIITEQILLTIKNSNKMLTDVNILV